MSDGRSGFVPWELDLIERSHLLRLEIDELAAIGRAAATDLNVTSAVQLLEHLESDLINGEQVSIALLGGTGSGKSTLLNALLGARIVPTSSMRACTSVITKARWSEGPGFTATVHFVPRDSWTRQVQHLAADLTAHAHPDSEGDTVGDGTSIPKDDQDRLRAVYGDESTQRFLKTGDIGVLEEPASITHAFEEGHHRIDEGVLDNFRSKVKGYLDSSEHYWPIVESVEISGPFEVLRSGGELVDLPGLNDPNEAREATTKAYLETAKFVWVVFNMKRNLTKEMTDTLRSRDLLRRLLAGGRLATITLVGTASDDLDPESDCEALGLPEDAPIDEIVVKRNQRSVEIARDQLRTLADELGAGISGDSELAGITQSLLESPVFTVSARDFLALRGITRVVPSIGVEPLTQIPDLRAHFERITTEAGPWAQAMHGYTQLEGAVAELQRVVQQERAHFELAAVSEAAEREEIASSIEAAGAEFGDKASSVLGRLRRSLHEASQRFDASLKDGEDGAVSSLQRVTLQWRHIHWATLRATSVRGGNYVSPTFGAIDLVQEVSTPIIDRALAPWIAFYDRELVQVLSDANNELGSIVVDYAAAVGMIAEQQPDLARSVLGQLKRLVDDVTKSIEASLGLLRSSLSSQVSQDRQQLHRLTYENVAESLEAAFVKAGRESGAGMKARMLDTLGSAVSKSARPEYIKVASILHAKVLATSDLVGVQLAQAVSDVVAKADEVSTGLRRVALRPATRDDAWIRDLEEVAENLPGRYLATLEPPEFLQSTGSAGVSSASNDHVSTAVVERPLVLIDGANVCSSPGLGPDMKRLRSAIDAAKEYWSDCEVITVVDRSLHGYLARRNDHEQGAELEAMVRDLLVLEPPPGHPGKADSYILMLAAERFGVVLSNDSFKEFQHVYPWVASPDRLYGYTFHPSLGWTFTPRFAVRPNRPK